MIDRQDVETKNEVWRRRSPEASLWRRPKAKRKSGVEESIALKVSNAPQTLSWIKGRHEGIEQGGKEGWQGKGEDGKWKVEGGSLKLSVRNLRKTMLANTQYTLTNALKE